MTRYVLDSFAWIEFLEGTGLGAQVRVLIEDEANELFTPATCAAEVVSCAARRGQDARRAAEAIESGSVVVALDFTLAVTSGRIHAEKRREKRDFPHGDAAVLATARALRAKVVTGDPHFRGEPDVHFLE